MQRRTLAKRYTMPQYQNELYQRSPCSASPTQYSTQLCLYHAQLDCARTLRDFTRHCLGNTKCRLLHYAIFNPPESPSNDSVSPHPYA